MGTSTAKDLFNASSRDHPHAYGDKELNLKWDFGLIGSSPRVWGQAATVLSTINKLGIIPTRMGTSF